MTREELLHREIINALWPHLLAGNWGPHVTRDLDDYGDNPGFHSIATATIPNAPAQHCHITTTRRLALIATTETTPPHSVVLTEDAYQHALVTMTPDQFLAHQHSITGTRPAPYRWTTDRNGERYLAARKEGWDHTWSRHARSALDLIAELAHTWPLTDDPPEALAACIH